MGNLFNIYRNSTIRLHTQASGMWSTARELWSKITESLSRGYSYRNLRTLSAVESSWRNGGKWSNRVKPKIMCDKGPKWNICWTARWNFFPVYPENFQSDWCKNAPLGASGLNVWIILTNWSSRWRCYERYDRPCTEFMRVIPETSGKSDMEQTPEYLFYLHCSNWRRTTLTRHSCPTKVGNIFHIPCQWP